MGWWWNPKAARYQWRNGGSRFLSRRTVLSYIEQDIATAGNATDVLARLVANGQVTPDDWQTLMRQYVKDEHIRMGVLARGGRDQMTPSDWGTVGATLRDQYGYLQGFTDRIALGELSEAQIAANSKMYINAAREAYERINLKVQREAGYDEMAWILEPG